MIIGKVPRFFAGKIKPLSIKGQSTQKGLKITSLEDNKTYEIQSPLQTLLACLPACELSTMRVLTKAGKLKIGKVTFTRVESGYDRMHFVQGGKQNHIENVKLWAEVQTNGTQQDLEQLQKKVQNSCPVYQTFQAAGIKITNHWTNIQTVL